MDLANLYRPKKLDDLVGQDVPVRCISNAFKAKNMHQSYIFEGQYGSGKCIVGNSLVYTSNGMKPIQKFIS